MSSFFIKHPTIAIVISIVMILLGGLSLMGLPIEQYPNIVPPTIKMQATYPGANAEHGGQLRGLPPLSNPFPASWGWTT